MKIVAPFVSVGLVRRREHYKADLLDAVRDSILEAIPESLRKINEKDLDVLPIK